MRHKIKVFDTNELTYDYAYFTSLTMSVNEFLLINFDCSKIMIMIWWQDTDNGWKWQIKIKC